VSDNNNNNAARPLIVLAMAKASTSTSDFYKDVDQDLLESGYKRPPVNWYPGHIAKAERQLSETLRAVDVVVEVRDARACKATSHPRVGEWCAGRPRIVVLTHVDSIPKSAEVAWRRSYENFGAERWDEAPINSQISNQAKQAKDFRIKFVPPSGGKAAGAGNEKDNANAGAAISPVEQVLFVNAKMGAGIHTLHRAILKAGAHVQERRDRRGLKDRPLRVGIIGYPNVGKVCTTAATITHIQRGGTCTDVECSRLKFCFFAILIELFSLVYY
jgi:hypothetical protein